MAKIKQGRRSLALVAATLMLAACGQEGPAGEKEGPPPPEVGVVELRSQRVNLSARLPGRVAAYRVAEVRPQVTGVIEERSFKQGARVEAGETLYEIDPKPYRAAYARAEADLARARASVEALRQRERRFASLVEDDAVSRQEYDDVKAELDQQLAEVQVAEAALETVRIDLGYTSVESPITGRVGPTLVTVGALATANQEQPLARVTRLDPIYVDIQRSVSELMTLRRALENGDLAQAGPGEAAVRLLLENGETYPHEGRLEVSDVTVNPGTASVTLRAVFPNPDHTLLPGMYVRAELSEGVRESAILAPQQGVTRNPRGEPTALVLDDEDRVVRRTIEADRAIDSFWLVEKGLAAGDRLIVTGLQKVSPGDRVRPVPAEIPNRQPGGEIGADESTRKQADREDRDNG